MQIGSNETREAVASSAELETTSAPLIAKSLALSPAVTLPSFTELFGTIDKIEGQEARSVLSPAAYLADLLQLKDSFTPGNGYYTRRPDVRAIPLDDLHTFGEVPYLEISNGIMTALAGHDVSGKAVDVDAKLESERFPPPLPFELEHERIKLYLDKLGTNLSELYRTYARDVDGHEVARLRLGLSKAEYDLFSTLHEDNAELDAIWGIADDAERNRLYNGELGLLKKKLGVSHKELKALLYQDLSDEELKTTTSDGVPRESEASRFFINFIPHEPTLLLPYLTLMPFGDAEAVRLSDGAPMAPRHADRLMRFVRLARRLQLEFSELDWILQSACANELDADALQALAVVLDLKSKTGLPVDQLCALWAPPKKHGRGDGAESQALFDRIFNQGYAQPIEALVGPDFSEQLANRLVAALRIRRADYDVLTRALAERGTPATASIPYFAVLYRMVTLAELLSLSLQELVVYLDVLDAQWRTAAHEELALPVPYAHMGNGEAHLRPCLHALTNPGTPPRATLAALQKIFRVKEWLNQRQLSVRQLAFICLERFDDGAAIDGVLSADSLESMLDEVYQTLLGMMLQPGDLQTGSLTARGARAVFDALCTSRALFVAVDANTPSPKALIRLRPSQEELTAAMRMGVDERLEVYSGDFAPVGIPAEDVPKLLDLLTQRGYLEQLDGQYRLEVGARGFFLDRANLPHFFLPEFPEQKEALFGLFAEKAQTFLRAQERLDGEAKEIGDRVVSLFEQQARALQRTLSGQLALSDDLVDLLFYFVFGTPDEPPTQTFSNLTRPLFELEQRPDTRGRVLRNAYLASRFRRLQQFALLARKVGFTADEARVYLENQHVHRNLPETLKPSEGFFPSPARVDALTTLPNGDFVLISGQKHARFSSEDYRLLGEGNLAQLPGVSLPTSFLGGIDSAWRDADGVSYFCAGEQFVSSAEPGTPKRIADTWGKVRNHIQQQRRVDAAFQDERGRVFLFRGDQYVRYSEPQRLLTGNAFVDEGYPKSIRLGFAQEQVAALPGLMNARVDAAFRDTDGSYYFFSGNKFTHSTDPYDLRVIQSAWGRVRNRLFDENRVDAAFVQGDHTWLLRGEQLIRYTGGVYGFVDEAYPVSFGNIPESDGLLRVLKRFPQGIDAALTGSDGALYVFKDGSYASSTAPDTKRVTRERWGRVRNVFMDTGRVDAAFSHGGAVYLFSGDQYVRYSGPDYTFVDEGYPKRVHANWNQVEKIGVIPDGLPEPITAVASDPSGKVFFFGGNRFAGPDGHLGEIKEQWARVRNNIERLKRVDAAVTDGSGRFFLFSDDQFYRYSDSSQEFADEGYPKRLEGNWAREGQGWALPEGGFSGGISAALRAEDDRLFFFSGEQYARVDARTPARPVREDWGLVRNQIAALSRVDTAFRDPNGHTYMFGGGQFVRYSGDSYEYVDEGYPKSVSDLWGNLPQSFRDRIDAALSISVNGAQRLYLFRGRDFVRYSTSDYSQVDPGYPKPTADGVQSEGQWFRGFVVHDPADPQSNDTNLIIEGTYVDTYQGQARICVFYRHPGGGQWKREYRADGPNRYRWTKPQRVEDLDEYLPFKRVEAAFVAGDGTLHVFCDERYASRPPGGGPLSEPVPTRERWARVWNQFSELGRVDAALDMEDGRTYLFCDQQYIRYSGALKPGDKDFFVDEGYPKRIAPNWSREGVPILLAGGVKAEGSALCRDAHGTIHLFDGPNYTSSAAPSMQVPVISRWGRVENRFQELNRIDAAYRAENGALYLFCDDQYTRYSGPLRPGTAQFYTDEGYPKRLAANWAREKLAIAMPERFTALGSAVLRDARQTYVFSGTRFTSSQHPEPRPVIEQWAKVDNRIQEQNRVDAGFVLSRNSSSVTLLFSGDQYVRYSGTYEGFVDEGYPKRISRLSEVEGVFPLPSQFLGGLRAAFAGRDGNLHAFTRTSGPDETQAYVCSARPDALLSPREKWGIVDNKLYDQSFVNAALLAPDGKLYLFSANQYVRYSGSNREYVDEGYPKRVVPNWAVEIHAAGLPPIMERGVDAALTLDGTSFYFVEDQYVASDAPQTSRPLIERWGRVENRLQETSRIDAGFVSPDGRLYLFTGDQYAVYSGTSREYVDEGFPKKIGNNLGKQWPESFRKDLDSACAFEGRSYLFKGAEHVRISDLHLGVPDRNYPRAIPEKFADRRDFTLGALPDTWAFKDLSDTYGSSPRTFLQYLELPTPGAPELASMTKWSESEISWLRNKVALPGSGLSDSRTISGLARHFGYADRLGGTPSNLETQLWERLFGQTAKNGARKTAADLAYGLVKARTSTRDWPTVARTLRDPLNAARRDALVSYLVHTRGLGDANDLYETLLNDVNMGVEATTSPIAEAIASIQLYYHRSLMNLEQVPSGLKNILKQWWSWMKNYRVWEANRRVFLHPENYIRPELRTLKSPAFATLEENLLQDKITDKSVQEAYKTYLDQFTEVSRLRIAGGYTYRDEQGQDYVLMLGFARTEPLTYYSRFGKLPTNPSDSIAWDPWEKINITINAEKVQPVYAFNKIFLFWFEQEAINETVFSTSGEYGADSGQTKLESKPVIKYSFYNFNKEWIPPQTIRAELRRIVGPNTLSNSWSADQLKRARLYVTNPSVKNEYDPNAYIYILLSIQNITDALVGRLTAALDFEPRSAITAEELVSLAVSIDLTPSFPSRLGLQPDSFARWGSYFRGIMTTPWFSFEENGGSFLSRPHEPPPVSLEDIRKTLEIKGHVFTKVDAAFSTPGGDLFVFTTENNRLCHYHYGAGAGGQKTWQGPVFMDDTLPSGEPVWPWGNLRGLFVQHPERRITNVVVVDGKTYVLTSSGYFTYASSDYRFIDQKLPGQLLTGKPALDVLVSGASEMTNWRWAFEGQRELVRAFKYDGLLVLVTRTPQGLLEYARVSLDQLRHFVSSIPTAPADLFKDWDGIDTVFTVTSGQTRTLTLTHERQLATLSWQDQAWSVGNLLDVYRVAQGRLSAAFTGTDGTLYFICDNTYAEITAQPEFRPVAQKWGRYPPLFPDILSSVNAALMGLDGKLYLFCGEYCLRYSQFDPAALSSLVLDDESPRKTPEVWETRGLGVITAAFHLDSKTYLFGIRNGFPTYVRYSSLPAGHIFNPDAGYPKPVQGAWGNLPTSYHPGFDSAIEVPGESGGKDELYLTRGSEMIVYGGASGHRLYETSEVKYSIVRLTSNTAERFSQLLLGRGISGLLSLSTQKTEEANKHLELPRFSINPQERWLQDVVVCSRTDYLVDYPGKPDPSTPSQGSQLDFKSANGFYYWEIFFHIPYLIAQALNQAQRFDEAKTWYEYIFDPTEARTGSSDRAFWKFLPFHDASDGSDWKYLEDPYQLAKYRDDPFDPHGLAQLRPIAYRKSIVMSYIDNLLDWGDLLFQQYTRESIGEATMLYVLAADLLGKAPEERGKRKLKSDTKTYEQLQKDALAAHLIELENTTPMAPGKELAKLGSTPNDTILSPYFFIPENEEFIAYWSRVGDRLEKIRKGLNIEGVRQALALFEPRLDVMALVKAFAAGGGIAQALSDYNVLVPHYRFSFMLSKARELAGRLMQLGGSLLSALEKKDAEELSLLRNTQERAILEMTLQIRQQQLENATQSVLGLRASLKSAQRRQAHYQKLLAENLSPYELLQLASMAVSQGLSQDASVLNIASSVASLIPQVGSPFAMTFGGLQISPSLRAISDSFKMQADKASFAGTLAATLGGWDRRRQEWELQQALATVDVEQIGRQIAAAEIQVEIARQEIQVQRRQIQHNQSVDTFMRSKFTNQQLYRWMTGKLSAVYFQTYQLALDYAKAAQRALQFEMGWAESDVQYIGAYYWDSLHKGLLAGEQLQLDLDRLEKAHLEKNKRRFEVTKTISLMLVDPLAFLRLKQQGNCEFELPESLFDYDFPGHYCRQLKTVSVSFPAVVGPYENFNATLTQMSHRTVLRPEIGAVKYLLKAEGDAPESIRSDWRPNQQVALSRGVNDSGLFQLNFQDERYLPFEGTGAVSRWRLEITGVDGASHREHLSDVIITLQYTALPGGEDFAEKVKSALPAVERARMLNLAYDFPEAWQAFMSDPSRGLTFTVERQHIPGASQPKVQGLYLQYDLTESGTGAIGRQAMRLDGELELTPGSSRDGMNKPLGTWKLMPTGRVNKFTPENIRNLALVVLYSSKPTF